TGDAETPNLQFHDGDLAEYGWEPYTGPRDGLTPVAERQPGRRLPRLLATPASLSETAWRSCAPRTTTSACTWPRAGATANGSTSRSACTRSATRPATRPTTRKSSPGTSTTATSGATTAGPGLPSTNSGSSPGRETVGSPRST